MLQDGSDRDRGDHVCELLSCTTLTVLPMAAKMPTLQTARAERASQHKDNLLQLILTLLAVALGGGQQLLLA